MPPTVSTTGCVLPVLWVHLPILPGYSKECAWVDRQVTRRLKILNLRVMKIVPENNLLILKGSVPGSNGSYLIIEK